MKPIRRLTAIQIRFTGDENLLIRVSPGYKAYSALQGSDRSDLEEMLRGVLTNACKSMTDEEFDVAALVEACQSRTLTTDFNNAHPRGARITSIIVATDDIRVCPGKPEVHVNKASIKSHNRGSHRSQAIRSPHTTRALAPALAGVR